MNTHSPCAPVFRRAVTWSFLLVGCAIFTAMTGTVMANTQTQADVKEACHQAWKQSEAQNTCTDPYNTPGGWGGIEAHTNVSPAECTLKSACDLDSGACCYAAAFRGTADEIKTLKNCNGELAANTCP